MRASPPGPVASPSSTVQFIVSEKPKKMFTLPSNGTNMLWRPGPLESFLSLSMVTPSGTPWTFRLKWGPLKSIPGLRRGWFAAKATETVRSSVSAIAVAIFIFMGRILLFRISGIVSSNKYYCVLGEQKYKIQELAKPC